MTDIVFQPDFEIANDLFFAGVVQDLVAISGVEFAADVCIAAAAKKVYSVTESFDAADDRIITAADQEDRKLRIGNFPVFFSVDFGYQAGKRAIAVHGKRKTAQAVRFVVFAVLHVYAEPGIVFSLFSEYFVIAAQRHLI